MKKNTGTFIFIFIILLSGCVNKGHDRIEQSRPNVLFQQNNRDGENAARELTNWYNDTVDDCGYFDSPAYLCSGILIRVTDNNPTFYSWDPSPSAIKLGGISFSWLRKDLNFTSLAFNKKHGYILYPENQKPFNKTTELEVLCAFPLDADSWQRSSNGCGMRGANSSTDFCDRLNIHTANEWVNAFAKVGKNYAYQCGFNLRNGEQNRVERFKQVILARHLLGKGEKRYNELVIKTWDNGIGDKLPIHSFFYINGNNSALIDAQTDQQRYYDLYNEIIPVVQITPATSVDGEYLFKFIGSDQKVKELFDLDSLMPLVPQATGTDGNYLSNKDYYKLDKLKVIVPQYKNMKLGDVLNVVWRGPYHTYYSKKLQVKKIEDMSFEIPREEFIDSIGNTAEVWFSLHQPNGNILNSRVRTIFIENQLLNLPAPIFDEWNKQVIVDFFEMTPSDTIGVRLIGEKSTLDLKYTRGNNSGRVGFIVPSSFIKSNQGYTVSIIYSVSVNGSSALQFSRMLRIKL